MIFKEKLKNENVVIEYLLKKEGEKKKGDINNFIILLLLKDEIDYLIKQDKNLKKSSVLKLFYEKYPNLTISKTTIDTTKRIEYSDLFGTKEVHGCKAIDVIATSQLNLLKKDELLNTKEEYSKSRIFYDNGYFEVEKLQNKKWISEDGFRHYIDAYDLVQEIEK